MTAGYVDGTRATVDSIIRGSANIDRMKDETNVLVRMLLGMVAPAANVPKGKTLILSQDGQSPTGCAWSMIRWSKQLVVKCERQVVVPAPERIKIDIAFTTDDRWNLDEFGRLSEFMGVAGVKFAYDNLPLFLTGMLQTFPFSLERKLLPFIEAA